MLSAANLCPFVGLTPRAKAGIAEAWTNEAPNDEAYWAGWAAEIPKFLNCLFKATAGESHWIKTFFGAGAGISLGAGLNTTLLDLCGYSNHLSTIMSCGGWGNCGNLSVITFLGGGGITLPGITWCSGAIGAGGIGGLSRTTNGAGLTGSGGLWRIKCGGAGAAWTSFCWVMTISPGCCGGGGCKNLTETCWV